MLEPSQERARTLFLKFCNFAKKRIEKRKIIKWKKNNKMINLMLQVFSSIYLKSLCSSFQRIILQFFFRSNYKIINYLNVFQFFSRVLFVPSYFDWITTDLIYKVYFFFKLIELLLINFCRCLHILMTLWFEIIFDLIKLIIEIINCLMVVGCNLSL